MTAIREVMTKELVTVEPATSVAAAVTVMGMHHRVAHELLDCSASRLDR